MKRISVLALAAAIGLLQTGCFNRSAANNQPQEAQAAAIATQPAAAPAQAVAPAQAAAPVAAAPAAVAPAAPAPVAPAPVAPAPVAAAPAPMQVNANSYFVSTNDGTALNVRASTSTQAQVVGSLPQGTQVLMHLSDRSGQWFEVSAAGGVRGWVAAAYLVNPQGQRAANSLPAQVAPAPAPQAYNAYDEGHGEFYSDYYIQTMDGDPLNMREGPFLGARVLRALPNGTDVAHVDTAGQWTEVMTADGLVGYVASDYLVNIHY